MATSIMHKKLVSSFVQFSSYGNRQTDKQANRQTDILIVILCMPPGNKVTRHPTPHSCIDEEWNLSTLHVKYHFIGATCRLARVISIPAYALIKQGIAAKRYALTEAYRWCSHMANASEVARPRIRCRPY